MPDPSTGRLVNDCVCNAEELWNANASNVFVVMTKERMELLSCEWFYET